MSEQSSGITKEQAIRFGKLYRGEIEIVDPVYLKTTHVSDGKVVWSDAIEREVLVAWMTRAKRENSQQCVTWDLHKERGEEI